MNCSLQEDDPNVSPLPGGEFKVLRLETVTMASPDRSSLPEIKASEAATTQHGGGGRGSGRNQRQRQRREKRIRAGFYSSAGARRLVTVLVFDVISRCFDVLLTLLLLLLCVWRFRPRRRRRRTSP